MFPDMSFYRTPLMPNHFIENFTLSISGGPTVSLQGVELIEVLNKISEICSSTPFVPSLLQLKADMDRISDINIKPEQNVDTRRSTDTDS